MNVRYYAANREREIERVTKRQAATTAFLRQLREVPCADCGGRFAGHQMDFDHRDQSQKRFSLSSGGSAFKSRAELLEEAASAMSSVRTVIDCVRVLRIASGYRLEPNRC
jgi:hypothetical protein